jgi:diguanylate cyclase (GGDEF)-like protein
MLVGTLLCLDIDGFKTVNDRRGHAVGDDTLQLVARIIGDTVREGDRAARMGDDEFLVVLPDVSDYETTMNVVARIRSAVEALRPLGAGDDTRTGISIGVGHFADAAAISDALHEADTDLYRRKSGRRSNAAIAASRGTPPSSATRFRVPSRLGTPE